MEEALEANEEWTPAEDFDTGLTADDWKEILEDDDFIKKHPAGSIALWLYYDNRNDTPLSYTGLAEKYGIYDGYYKGGMGQFDTGLACSTKFNISLKFKEKIRPYTDENGNNNYWYLSFMGRKATKEEPGSFIFKLRKEVCDGFDKLSEERRQMFEEMYQHQKKTKPKIWLCTTGEKSDQWNNFVQKPQKIAIGHNLGDLTNNSRNEIKKLGNEESDGSGPSFVKFVCDAKAGDLVFARYGNHIKGFGCIMGEYQYVPEGNSYCNIRNVEWYENKLDISFDGPGFGNTYFIELANKYRNKEINEIIKKYTDGQYAEIADNTSESIEEKVENMSSEKNDKEPLELIEESSLTPKEKEWGRMLVNSHQIILTGAPGTGKTFAAQKIANVLTENKKENIGFVQFHPSMDYTDFMEGLRPEDQNGNIGFKRQDGIFKKFCANAVANWEKAQLSPEKQKANQIVEKDFNNFIKTAEDTDHKFTLIKQNYFTINGKVENKLILDTPHTKGKEWSIPIDRILKAYSHFYLEMNDEPLKTGRQIENYLFKSNNAEANYILPIIQDFHSFRTDKKETNDTPDSPKEESKNFVFIIDEINRGDIAKIFGELFYAIDPSYRGEKGRIKTQYQNLVEDEPFDNGFYVPENVYIIGTMNDIDRGVESMDFAIRRRFTWIEVKPEDTQSMLASLTASQTVKDKMNALNNVISEKIGPAYQIGGAYFLKLKELKKLKDDGRLEGGQDEFDALWKYHLEPLLREYLRGEPKNEIKEKIKEMGTAYGIKYETEKDETSKQNAPSAEE